MKQQCKEYAFLRAQINDAFKNIQAFQDQIHKWRQILYSPKKANLHHPRLKNNTTQQDTLFHQYPSCDDPLKYDANSQISYQDTNGNNQYLYSEKSTTTNTADFGKYAPKSTKILSQCICPNTRPIKKSHFTKKNSQESDRKKKSANFEIKQDEKWQCDGINESNGYSGYAQLHYNGQLIYSGGMSDARFHGRGKIKYMSIFKHLFSIRSINKLIKNISEKVVGWAFYFGEFTEGAAEGLGELWLDEEGHRKIRGIWLNGNLQPLFVLVE